MRELGRELGRGLALGLILVLAGCVTEAPKPAPQDHVALGPRFETPEGWPWTMGQMTATIGAQRQGYTIYDFSIGAVDASAQMSWAPDADRKITPGGPVSFLLNAHPGADPKAKGGVIFLRAEFSEMPKAGASTQKVTVRVPRTGGYDGPGLWAREAELRLDGLSRAAGEDWRGRVSGRVTGVLCASDGTGLIPGGACESFSAQFDTELRYNM